MEKDPYLYGLPATAVGTRTRVTATGIPTVFSHCRYPVQRKEGEFVGISVCKLFNTPLPPRETRCSANRCGYYRRRILDREIARYRRTCLSDSTESER